LDKKDYFRRSIQRLIDHKSTSVPTIKSRLPMIMLTKLSTPSILKWALGKSVKFQY